jgi:hypothetical protein
MQIVAVVIAVVVGLGIMAILFKPFFGDVGELVRCLKFWLTPDVVSMFRGEWGEDRWASMKLGFWILAGGVCGVATYFGLLRTFG